MATFLNGLNRICLKTVECFQVLIFNVSLSIFKILLNGFKYNDWKALFGPSMRSNRYR